VNHVVNSILAPFGEPIENRPPVPTLEERLGMREEKRRAREGRRKAKRREEVAGVESERVKGGECKEGGETVVQAARVQEVKEAEEIQMRSAEGREESSVSEDEKAAKEAKEEANEEAKEEAKGGDEAQKPKSWWRL